MDVICYAPINVKPEGGYFDIFFKKKFKFPTPGRK